MKVSVFSRGCKVFILLAIFMSVTSYAQQWMGEPFLIESQSFPTTAKGTTIAPTGSELWWGYFSENDEIYGFGVGSHVDYEAAIRIPSYHPQLENAIIKAIRVWIGNSSISKITSFKVWITKRLTNYAEGADYVQEVDVSSLSAGSNDIALNIPYSIHGKEIYVGYTMKLSSQAYAIIEGGEWVENSFYYRVSEGSTEWIEASNFGKLALKILVDGVNANDNAASPSDFGTNYVIKGQEVMVPVKITNQGKNPLTSISYTITTNGNTTAEVTRNMGNIPINNSKVVDIPFAADSDTRKYDKTLRITKVNGQANEAEMTEQSASGQLMTILEKPTAVPVVEEFTGTWCGWCPIGYDGMESAHETFGDNVVLIAVHSGDVMQISDYSAIYNSVHSFPSSHINRSIDAYPSSSTLKKYINQCLDLTTVGEIEVSAEWADEYMYAIDITTHTKFVYSDDNANYGIALVLIEDGLNGTSSSWAQANNLSHRSGYESYSFWYNAESTVTGLDFNHVAVAAWNIKNGANNSVNPSFTAGESMKYKFQANINSKGLIQDKSKLKVAALLIDRNTGQIINAAQSTVDEYSAISNILDTNVIEVERYDINGHKLVTPQSGINIVRMSDGSVRKVLVK